MSFLGYIGRSLGAGSDPIARGQATSEYVADAPNRRRQRELEIAGLERTERQAQAAEAERERVAGLLQGRRPPTPPGGQLGVDNLPAPQGVGERIDIPQMPARAAGLPAASTVPAVAATTAAAAPTTPRQEVPAASPATGYKVPERGTLLIEERLTAIANQIREIEQRPNRGIMDPDLDRLRREQQSLANELRKQGRAAAPAPVPTAPPTGVAAPAAAAPAAAPVVATPPTQINPERDFEVYRMNPAQMSYDMQVVSSEYDRLSQRLQDIYTFADRTDAASMRAAFFAGQAIEDELVRMDGTYAKLQVNQGITAALSGDTSYIDTILTAGTGVPISVKPYMDQANQRIVYQIEVNGVPQGEGEFLTGDQMRMATMRMIDAQLDLQLTQTEAERSAKMAELVTDARLKGQLIELELSADLQRSMLEGTREQALELLKQSRPDMKEVTVLPDNTVVAMDELGNLYSFGIVEQRIGGKKRSVPTVTGIPRPRAGVTG